MKPKILILLAIFLIFESLAFVFPSSTQAVTNPISYEITVSASIGEGRLTLFGYTSPHALVQLEGRQIAEEVIAGENGFFFFDRIFLPKPNPQYPELCLNSIDTQSQISFPNCLPPLPTGPFNMSVGPVLLPPTFTLTKGSFFPKEQIVASGLTIPNSNVMIFLANDVTKKSFFSRLVPETFAYNLPQYQTQADQNGHFEFNLPTIKRSNWKIFAGANWQNFPTPKSNTLNFKIQSWWEWFWARIKWLLGVVLGLSRPFLWSIIVLIELTIVVVLLVGVAKRRQRSISNF
ncbi:hypothetical protein COU95_02895 [Candidatus Shapirobacteria bacterium CG10_big_fil_rev_8_21_14_0_10_40_9]|uniref:Uncharacterized protein n=1 Tax=Candidatus Shapirobacteria bacterium CG10_big_fil_rev_8_21_14_0_10_40_9 TaxID=1974888 RepID=A0A2M8L379_9BACT|nr:MAG: hypothetical protein COU95_02895 [Candidatus Shapirobacteria bacterium CG10_big_fil_rev_8_21_14_0_10_40_9]